MAAQRNPLEAGLHLLRVLLTSSLSMRMAAVSFASLLLLDRLFHFFLYSYYVAAISHFGEPALESIDSVFAPIVWLSFVSMLIASLTVVITFAATSTPKLIDIYMEHKPTLLWTWWSVGCLVHAVTVKYFPELGLGGESSMVFNYHILLPIFVFVSFPYILSTLYSTKTSNVIQSLLDDADEGFATLSNMGPEKALSPRWVQKQQVMYFESMNQLMDLLVYVPYKEPKAAIIEGIGKLLRSYAVYKRTFPKDFFKISPKARDDISFRTMQSMLPEIEEKETVFEQKTLRLVGNAYITFLEEGQFDLSTLCAEQLNQLGKLVVELGDETLMDLVIIRLNTHFRFALKHGQANNEPRNLYNLTFHYGQYVSYLVEHDRTDRVKTCFQYFGFYALQCFNAAPNAMAVGFILDILAVEMQKLLIALHQKKWEHDLQEHLLNQFLMLDNFQNVDRDFAKNFFSKSVGVRLLHIGLGLYYMEQGEEEWARRIAKDTLQDIELLGEELYQQTMNMIFFRLKVSGPTFWEDTDRGNLNIYYTPYGHHIEAFQAMQAEAREAEKQAAAPAVA